MGPTCMRPIAGTPIAGLSSPRFLHMSNVYSLELKRAHLYIDQKDYSTHRKRVILLSENARCRITSDVCTIYVHASSFILFRQRFISSFFTISLRASMHVCTCACVYARVRRLAVISSYICLN